MDLAFFLGLGEKVYFGFCELCDMFTTRKLGDFLSLTSRNLFDFIKLQFTRPQLKEDIGSWSDAGDIVSGFIDNLLSLTLFEFCIGASVTLLFTGILIGIVKWFIDILP